MLSGKCKTENFISQNASGAWHERQQEKVNCSPLLCCCWPMSLNFIVPWRLLSTVCDATTLARDDISHKISPTSNLLCSIRFGFGQHVLQLADFILMFQHLEHWNKIVITNVWYSSSWEDLPGKFANILMNGQRNSPALILSPSLSCKASIFSSSSFSSSVRMVMKQEDIFSSNICK